MNADLLNLRFLEVYQNEQGDIMSDFDSEMVDFFIEYNPFDGYSVLTEGELADQNYAEYERLKDLLEDA